MRIVTIGVYGRSKDEFFDALVRAGVGVFVDVRLHRGMRGAKYSFVNSAALQAELGILRIPYLHIKSCAPTRELRQIQSKRDESIGIAKQSRTELSAEFIASYSKQVSQSNCITDLFEAIQKVSGSQDTIIGLFCVEATSEACHRSVLARLIQAERDISVSHL